MGWVGLRVGISELFTTNIDVSSNILELFRPLQYKKMKPTSI